ncbi:MAG: DNA primase [Terrestrivirus sp.]|uniref:DNA primase n=1 Tax=Terrestrivirus sp. TaxID=2487775 RepID=A0A3G4ZKH0_9VIRU|nr:MAG: DNA primase [Terrestrivirus sp.]
MSNQYCYIIQEREFVNSNKSIYKIGKTTQQIHKRMNQYPKDSKVILTLNVVNCDEFEKNIKRIFPQKYKHRTDIGIEYFEGDVNEMVDEYISLNKSLNKSLTKNNNAVEKVIDEDNNLCILKEYVIYYVSSLTIFEMGKNIPLNAVYISFNDHIKEKYEKTVSKEEFIDILTKYRYKIKNDHILNVRFKNMKELTEI